MERVRVASLLAAVAATCCCVFPTGAGAVSRSYEEALSEMRRLSQLEPAEAPALRVESPDHVFPCTPLPRSASPPTSVHKLRPSDIKVVAALGDSLTAGFGMKGTNVFTLLSEHRQHSFSIGGGESFEKFITVPNILRGVGAALLGASSNSTPWKQNPIDREAAGFNMAVTGSTAQDLLAQAELLTELLQNDEQVNLQEDWKLVSLFIGGNDLCDSCKEEGHSTEEYVGNITETIDYIKERVPRVFVNLVQIMRVSPLKFVEKPESRLCGLNQIFCSCVLKATPAELEELEKLNTDYQTGLETLLDSGRYDNNDSFTVVLQPCIRDTQPPTLPNGTIDGSFFAPDCFHFASKGHETFASILWNNMVEPEKSKTLLDKLTYPPPPIVCPSEASPYLYTRKNSFAAAATTATTTATPTPKSTTTTPTPKLTTTTPTPKLTTTTPTPKLTTTTPTPKLTTTTPTAKSTTTTPTPKLTTATPTPKLTTATPTPKLTTATPTPKLTTTTPTPKLTTTTPTPKLTTATPTPKSSSASLRATGVTPSLLLLLPLVGLRHW